jgi:predicted metallopeptidase
MKTTTFLNEPIKMNAHDLFPCTSIFATTIDGELTDVINIKDSFNRLPQEEKLKVVSVLLEFCAAETSKLTNQNK